jgi:hypothetical protein
VGDSLAHRYLAILPRGQRVRARDLLRFFIFGGRYPTGSILRTACGNGTAMRWSPPLFASVRLWDSPLVLANGDRAADQQRQSHANVSTIPLNAAFLLRLAEVGEVFTV